jgi:hypothetical protein
LCAAVQSALGHEQFIKSASFHSRINRHLSNSTSVTSLPLILTFGAVDFFGKLLPNVAVGKIIFVQRLIENFVPGYIFAVILNNLSKK